MVLQAAASNQFKECYGVEKAETPAMYAKLMEKEFRKWMDWYGKTYTEFTVRSFLLQCFYVALPCQNFIAKVKFCFAIVHNKNIKHPLKKVKALAFLLMPSAVHKKIYVLKIL